MLKALIIDDEINQRENLRIILENHCDGISVIGEANNVIKGAALISKEDADVIFLDIQMPGGTGFDLMENLGTIDAKIVLVTAYDDYMRKAFKFNVFDYIVKPIDISEVKETVIRLKESTTESESNGSKISLPSSNGIRFIEKDQIVCIKAEGSYTTLILKDDQKVVVSRNLKFVESNLGSPSFLRVHRSFIINLNYVEELVKSDGGFVKLINNIEVPIAPSMRDELIQRMN